jgi:hypothetical protein
MSPRRSVPDTIQRPWYALDPQHKIGSLSQHKEVHDQQVCVQQLCLAVRESALSMFQMVQSPAGHN